MNKTEEVRSGHLVRAVPYILAYLLLCSIRLPSLSPSRKTFSSLCAINIVFSSSRYLVASTGRQAFENRGESYSPADFALLETQQFMHPSLLLRHSHSFTFFFYSLASHPALGTPRSRYIQKRSENEAQKEIIT